MSENYTVVLLVEQAVDELCFLLVGDDEAERTMELRYSSGEGSISIEGYTRLAGPPPEPNELSEQILSALVDEHEVVGHGDEVRFRLLKRREDG